MGIASKFRHAAPLLVVALTFACSGASAPRARPEAPPTAPTAPAEDGLTATLWVQTAVEAELLSEATFRSATAALDRALADLEWSALGQGPEARSLPAVIVDVDETVLDNSEYQAENLLRRREFDPKSWDAWVRRAAAPALPGAVAFARAVAARGVTLFYVTNRDADQEEATRQNLEQVGFPLPMEIDTVLCEHERSEWVREKESRRAVVASRYRVLLLLGDDLNDFVPAHRATLAERQALAERERAHFGRDWFLLANPLYGSWRRALEGFASGLAPEEARRLRASHLRGIP